MRTYSLLLIAGALQLAGATDESCSRPANPESVFFVSTDTNGGANKFWVTKKGEYKVEGADVSRPTFDNINVWWLCLVRLWGGTFQDFVSSTRDDPPGVYGAFGTDPGNNPGKDPKVPNFVGMPREIVDGWALQVGGTNTMDYRILFDTKAEADSFVKFVDIELFNNNDDGDPEKRCGKDPDGIVNPYGNVFKNELPVVKTADAEGKTFIKQDVAVLVKIYDENHEEVTRSDQTATDCEFEVVLLGNDCAPLATLHDALEVRDYLAGLLGGKRTKAGNFKSPRTQTPNRFNVQESKKECKISGAGVGGQDVWVFPFPNQATYFCDTLENLTTTKTSFIKPWLTNCDLPYHNPNPNLCAANKIDEQFFLGFPYP